MTEDEGPIQITICQGPPLCNHVFNEDDVEASDAYVEACQLCRIDQLSDDGVTWVTIRDPAKDNKA